MSRVLLVCNQFPKFSESFIANKFRLLIGRGWDVQVACNRSEPEQWAHFAQVLPREDYMGHVHLIEDFDDVVRRVEPDLVHFEFGHLARGRATAPALAGSRVAASLRGNDVNALGLDEPAYFDELWEGIDGLHVLSPFLFERAVARGCPPSMPHIVISPAVDAAAFDPGERPIEKVGTEARPLRILSVGRLHWMKGYSASLHAVALLRQRGVHVEYRIVGAPDYGEGMIEVLFAIHDNGLQDVVTLLGAAPQEEVRAQLRWADVFLHGAVSEGFCNAALEAQAMAVPVVCTEAVSANVLDGRTGLVAPLRDTRGLADRLARIAVDAKLRNRLGSAGRARAVTDFRIEDQIGRFDAWYRKLLSSPQESAKARSVRIQIRRRRLELVELEQERERLARDIERRESVEAVASLVDELVPEGDAILVVSRGDPSLVELPREAWHFPQAEGGVWLGHHPASSADAIAQLEELRERGARFLVFPRTALWWLEHYRGLHDHLEARHLRIAADATTGVLYELLDEGTVSARPDTGTEVAAR